VVKTLCLQQSRHEFNRVLLPPRNFYDSIEIIVTETTMLADLAEWVRKNLEEFGRLESSERERRAEELELAFEVVRIVCMYASELLAELKEERGKKKEDAQPPAQAAAEAQAQVQPQAEAQVQAQAQAQV